MNREKGGIVMRNVFKIFTYVIIALAVIGLISQLTTNTMGFLISVSITIIIAAVIFIVIRQVMMPKGQQASEIKKYKQAVKASKKKYQQTKISHIKNVKDNRPTTHRKRPRRKATHLRVIDGNKSNKKPNVH